jgi:phosphopantothenoylcysteine decarboxylase/phosphopantothenate--cysteine ligase
MLQHKRILLGVTGSIAAYKACDIVQRFKEKGAEVRVLMTHSATNIIHPNALATLSGHAVQSHIWDGVSEGTMSHIETARWADLFVIAPCTAHTLAELSTGLTGSPVSMTALAYKGPMAIAPAMNTMMLTSAPVQEHLGRLASRGVHLLPTLDGNLACGEVGEGKLTTPEEIVAYADLILEGGGPEPGVSPAPLAGKSVLISGGHTEEPLDGVRFLSNRSSGKTAIALARAFRLAGAKVHLVLGRTGPLEGGTPNGVALTRVHTSEEFHAVLTASAHTADAVIMAAAIADFIPVLPADASGKAGTGKWKGSRERKQLELAPAVNILEALGRAKRAGQVLVGFALETENAIDYGLAKMRARHCDLMVVNTPLSQAGLGFGEDAVEAVVLAAPTAGREDAVLPVLRVQGKSELAAEVVRRVARVWV